MRFHAILLLAAAHTAESLLRAALVSPGKAVSVSIEYTGAADAIDELSQELRKAKAAAIWCDDVDAVPAAPAGDDVVVPASDDARSSTRAEEENS